jgi:tetratricopeptide (TPR) repeat protein
MRAALEWSLEGAEPGTGLRIVGAMWPYWWRQGHHVEWRSWVSRAEKVSAGTTPVVRAGVLNAKGRLLWAFNNLTESRQAHTEALAIFRPLGDAYDTGMALADLAAASFGIAAEYAEAIASCQEGLALLRQTDDKGAIAQALNILGELARNHGDTDLAQSAYEECLAIAREIGDKLREEFQYGNLGAVALNRGEYDQARQFQKRAMMLAAEIGNKHGILDHMAFMACVMTGRGQPRRAARLIGASEALHTGMEVEMQASDLPDYERWVAMLREQLGEETFNALRAEGSVMSLDEAVKYALEDTGGDD